MVVVRARQGMQVCQAVGLGFLWGSGEEPGVIGSLPRISCHKASFDFNSEWLRVLMQSTKCLAAI
jgi:hypothetical protein